MGPGPEDAHQPLSRFISRKHRGSGCQALTRWQASAGSSLATKMFSAVDRCAFVLRWGNGY